MRANYKSKIITTDNVEDAVAKEWDKKIDLLYEEVKKDVVAQLMATVLCYLHQRYGWGGKVLNSVKEGTEDLFKMMLKDGIMGKPFTTDNCIEYMRSLGVEFDD